MILIVSDNKPSTDRLKSTLEGEGYKTFIAITEKRAIEINKSIGPAIVFISFELSGVDSMDVIDAIKDPSGFTNIIMTGTEISNGMMVKSILRGADDVIDATSSPDKILAITQRLLASSFIDTSRCGTKNVNTKTMNNKSILVVDPGMSTRKVFSEVLIEKGYKVFTAETGEEALDLLDSESIDIVLMEMHLTDIFGFELYSKIKKSREDLPVIMTSSHANLNIVFEAGKMGVYEFLEKPISLDNLITVIMRAFG